jgi:hypothetical protein
LALLTLAGCASARMSDHVSDELFHEARYDEAAARLKAGLEKQGTDGRDSLLYTLDLALALHSAGRFDESTKYFREADRLAEIKDYTSLSKEAGSLLTSENIKDYKAEDFENVLINAYLAMNYALQGNREDALVEARRVNQKIYLMVSEGKRKYQQSAFARYLSAVLYEADGNYGDAYIDYKNTHDLAPWVPSLGQDLWRCAKLTGIDEDMEKWDQEYHLTAADHQNALRAGPKSGLGEIVVIYENGISPKKYPNPAFRTLPKFYPRFNPVRGAAVIVNGQPTVNTFVLDDIEQKAIENLDEKYGGMIAKKIGGIVAKEAVGDVVANETHSEILGALTKLAFYASDQADVRSWNLLPRDLQMARIQIAPGSYQVHVAPFGGPMSPDRTVQVAAGQKVFVDFRYMP